jgi:hypothetical protein
MVPNPGAATPGDSALDRLTRQPWAFVILCLPMAILAGFLMMVLAGAELLRSIDVAQNGAAARGKVTYIAHGKGSSRAVDVLFQPADGSNVTFRSSFQGTLEVGDEVPVLFLPAEPKKARIDSVLELWGAPAFMGGFAMMMAFGPIVFLYARRKDWMAMLGRLKT